MRPSVLEKETQSAQNERRMGWRSGSDKWIRKWKSDRGIGEGWTETDREGGWGVSETQQHLLARGSMASLSERNSSSCPKKPNSECIRHKTDEKRKTHSRKEVGERVWEVIIPWDILEKWHKDSGDMGGISYLPSSLPSSLWNDRQCEVFSNSRDDLLHI